MWPHTVVAALPVSLLEVLHAPTPFLVGILTPHLSRVLSSDTPLDPQVRARDYIPPPEQRPSTEKVMLVHLDERRIVRAVGDEGRVLPRRLHRALVALLDKVLADATRSRDTADFLNILLPEVPEDTQHSLVLKKLRTTTTR